MQKHNQLAKWLIQQVWVKPLPALVVLCCLPVCSSSELLQFDQLKDGLSNIKEVIGSNTVIGGQLPALPVENVPKAPPESQKAGSSLTYGFIHAFIASFSVIIVSELGDKTFFIAAIMAMRHSRTVVFIGAMAALILMTMLSVFLGYATTVIPRKYTFYISTALFIIFGLKMLKEGWKMDPNEGQEEYEEVSAELKKKEAELEADQVQDVETGVVKSKVQRYRIYRLCTRLCSPILIQALTLTFLAEWGDRSQLATIVLGSREDPFGVTLGAVLGHSLCTGLAVIGGRLVAQRISVRTVTLVAGFVFLLFGASAFFIHDY